MLSYVLKFTISASMSFWNANWNINLFVNSVGTFLKETAFYCQPMYYFLQAKLYICFVECFVNVFCFLLFFLVGFLDIPACAQIGPRNGKCTAQALYFLILLLECTLNGDCEWSPELFFLFCILFSTLSYL